MSLYTKKCVLVTGGTGLVGTPLVQMLAEQEANVKVVSMDEPLIRTPWVHYIQADLRDWTTCRQLAFGQDFVFHLAGTKSGVGLNPKHVAQFFVPQMIYNFQMMEAARQSGVERYLYCSSIGIYGQSGWNIFREEDAWKTFPDRANWFQGWAKRMGELQAETYQKSYDWNGIAVARLSGVYGPYDYYDPETSQVVTSLIVRALEAERTGEPLIVRGSKNTWRDWLYCEDAARGLLILMERGCGSGPINIGFGCAQFLAQLVAVIQLQVNIPDVVWDDTEPTGPRGAALSIKLAQGLGFDPIVSLEEGVKRTVSYFREHPPQSRYNVLTQAGPLIP